MSLLLRVRRGPAIDLPKLAEGEWGLTTDTHEVYMGTSAGNMKVGSYTDVTGQIAAHKVEAAAHDVSVITGAESVVGAQAKADAAQAAASSWVTTNYYNKTTTDGRYMPAGMKPIIAAIIFGG